MQGRANSWRTACSSMPTLCPTTPWLPLGAPKPVVPCGLRIYAQPTSSSTSAAPVSLEVASAVVCPSYLGKSKSSQPAAHLITHISAPPQSHLRGVALTPGLASCTPNVPSHTGMLARVWTAGTSLPSRRTTRRMGNPSTDA
jgi:hypothetical protein